MSDLSSRQPTRKRQFASDNYAGICPEAWEALTQANMDHAAVYGADPWTARATNLLREIFECDCEIFFVFNGTAANSLALTTLAHSHQGILCHESSHLQTDECGAPEFFTGGSKLLLVAGPQGRMTAANLDTIASSRTDVHFPKASAVSVTQATELGTVYSLDELRALNAIAQKHQLRIHMDGARLANAIAALQTSPAEVTWKAGVDVLSLGGTKNGLAVGEAVIFFRKDLADEFAYRVKQTGQLASKMRFLTAPWVGLLESGAWLRNAQNANLRAAQLQQRLSQIPGVKFLTTRQVNSVFIDLPTHVIEGLRARDWRFYTFIGETGIRLMCAWDTTESDIEQLAADLCELLAAPPPITATSLPRTR